MEPHELDSRDFFHHYLEGEEKEVDVERGEEEEKDLWGRYGDEEECSLRRCRKGKFYKV